MIKKVLLFLWSLSLCIAPLLCEPTHLVIGPGVLTEKEDASDSTSYTELTQEEAAIKEQNEKEINFPIFAASSLLYAALYGTGMYYYPKHLGFLTLLGYSAGYLDALIKNKYYKGLSNAANWLCREEALYALQTLSIVAGLAAGYGISVYAKGART